jgi:hypothetical protein
LRSICGNQLADRQSVRKNSKAGSIWPSHLLGDGRPPGRVRMPLAGIAPTTCRCPITAWCRGTRRSRLAEGTGSSGSPTRKATPFAPPFPSATGRLPVARPSRPLVSHERPAAAWQPHGAGERAEAAGAERGEAARGWRRSRPVRPIPAPSPMPGRL